MSSTILAGELEAFASHEAVLIRHGRIDGILFSVARSSIRRSVAAGIEAEEFGDTNAVDAFEEVAKPRHDRMHLLRQVVLDVHL